jgi:protein-L-isoaspartate O-methyltransferase
MKRLADSYFDRIYAAADDPWGFETRWYEDRKYALTLAALPRQRYERAFEPGCAFGVLSERLAPRCDALIASELVSQVAERARRRLKDFAHVQVETAAIPDFWPSGRFDLIVLSEVVYYLTEAGAHELLARLAESTAEHAHVIGVHYRGVTDYPMTGDAAQTVLRSSACLKSLARYEEELFALELFERVSP